MYRYFLSLWLAVSVEFFTGLSAFSSGQQAHFQSTLTGRVCLHRTGTDACITLEVYDNALSLLAVPVARFFIETDAQVCGHPGRCSNSA